MSATKRFTVEQVEAAVRENGGTAKGAAKALKCSDTTILNYLTGRRSNGHKTAVDALRDELSVHEADIARINGLLAERATHEEKAERLRMAIGILTPNTAPAPVAPQPVPVVSA